MVHAQCTIILIGQHVLYTCRDEFCVCADHKMKQVHIAPNFLHVLQVSP